jgi:hypothetical protein
MDMARGHQAGIDQRIESLDYELRAMEANYRATRGGENEIEEY